MLFVFFFNDTAPPDLYTLSLHDALPIWGPPRAQHVRGLAVDAVRGVYAKGALRQLVHSRRAHPGVELGHRDRDRKSTRLNSSHSSISYAVFCLKKKKKKKTIY